jgi:AcrR family transcriptional regulator
MPAPPARAVRRTGRARTRLDPEVRREQIIDAAEVVLTERDPADVTFEQIADAAGVSRGLVYNYFGDKAGLLAAVYLRNLDRLADALDSPLRVNDQRADDQLGRRLRSLVEVYLRFAADNPSAWKLIGTAETTEHPVVRRARRAHIERISASWGDTAEARVLGRGILGFLEAATVEWLGESDLGVEQAADVIYAQLWSGLGGDHDGDDDQDGTTVSTARQQYHATTLR